MRRSRPSINALRVVAALACVVIGCTSLTRMPPADLSEPGWNLRHGQVVWKPDREKPEIAGEIVFATRLGRETLLQFIKTPFPLVLARTTSNHWHIAFQERSVGGRGEPPERIGWFQLMRAFGRESIHPDWRCRKVADTGSSGPLTTVAIENPATGETLSGYLRQ